MDDLTPEELGFIRKRLKISADDIVDGRGISFEEATCKAERHNKRVILFQCCSKHANHRISNKHRRCLQCNPEYFAFANRKQSQSFVYIATSKSERLIKIGFTADPIERTKTLNYGYGSAEDWKILFWIEIEQAGEIEKSAQDQLMRFRL